MSEKVLQPGATISLDLEKIMERTGKGKIKIKAKNKSRYALLNDKAWAQRVRFARGCF